MYNKIRALYIFFFKHPLFHIFGDFGWDFLQLISLKKRCIVNSFTLSESACPLVEIIEVQAVHVTLYILACGLMQQSCGHNQSKLCSPTTVGHCETAACDSVSVGMKQRWGVREWWDSIMPLSCGITDIIFLRVKI